MAHLFKTITTIFAALIIIGCSEDPTYKIGISQCSQDDWREKMNEEIYRELMINPEAKVEIRSADDNNQKQIADIRYFAENDFDIIIAAPNEADAITPVIKEVYDSGIPVIVFDRNIHGDTYTAYYGVDNHNIGKAAAKYAASLIGNKGKIIEIYGLKGSTPALDRHTGFADTAHELGLDIIDQGFGNWNYDDAYAVADSLLAIHPETQLIYAHNDRMAIAASQAAKSRNLDIKIIGIDAAPEIGIQAVADGVIDATFLYPTEGYNLIRMALAILKGEKFDRQTINNVACAVDKNNAEVLLLQNKSLKEETNKMRELNAQINQYWATYSTQRTLLFATIAIATLLCALLFLLLRAFWQRKHHQEQLMEQNRQLEKQRDTEKELNKQLEEATQSKLVFFTNVSHDLRTPLTLIAEPVNQLSQAENLTPQQNSLIKIANKNVKILHRLINQILDFRKYENGKLNLSLNETPFTETVTYWADAFNALALKKHIKLQINIDLPQNFTIAIDTEKIERIFFNLMSNAFKYTPDNGKIIFRCNSADNMLYFSVEDNGQGISQEDLGNVFDRFFQVDKTHPNGSGIGLSLSKAFAELHGGEITAESELGKGSKFTVKIPIKHIEPDNKSNDQNHSITKSDIELELGSIDATKQNIDPDKPLLLVIDDNDDIRELVSQLLGQEYSIIQASNGKEGIRLAAKYVPDIIICDVMMPVMDGLECCRRLKEEITTSHIPVMLLTACSLDEQRAQGYESGADAYLPKPFSAAVLTARCHNLVENRRKIKELWSNPTQKIIPDNNTQTPRQPKDFESEFYQKFLEILDTEISDPNLNIDDLAAKLNLGRSQFYRKIKALTNYSPVELIRNIRIKRAHELLLSSDKSISEIAYAVGFSAPAYFTKCFRDVIGETPSEVRQRLGHK